MVVRDKSFASETLKLDGSTYRGCSFENCVLTYSGGAVPVFEDCWFKDGRYQLEGSALRTYAFLRSIAGPGGHAAKQALIAGLPELVRP